jgi:hypothetical protein
VNYRSPLLNSQFLMALKWLLKSSLTVFIFLIGYINVNKGVFCLIISYLRIKSYNVLNYNNRSTDWSFPLTTYFRLHIIVKPVLRGHPRDKTKWSFKTGYLLKEVPFI